MTRILLSALGCAVFAVAAVGQETGKDASDGFELLSRAGDVSTPAAARRPWILWPRGLLRAAAG